MPAIQISAQTKTLFWAGAFAAFVALIWLFQSILPPFILGLAIAYLLNPLVLRFSRGRLPRWAAVLIILSVFLGVVIIGLILLVPLMIREGAQFVEMLPLWLASVEETLIDLGNRFGFDITPDMQEIAGNLQGQAGQIFTAGKGVFAGLIAGGAAIVSFVSFVFLMPIVAFYMMVDWPRLTQKVKELVPRSRTVTIHNLMADIDRTLAGFVRGQLSVCVILGLFYGIGLTLIGLRFGFVIGMTAGILSIMPFVGSGIGLVLSIGVAWFTSHDWVLVGMAAGVFALGQFIEGNFLTPRLVGNNVGLHPLWVIFALMAGGALAGFVGLLVAVPVAAVIGVMVRFGISEYKKSDYYTA